MSANVHCMSEDDSSSGDYLSFTDYLIGTLSSIALVADGKLQLPEELRAQMQLPEELRAQIVRPLQLIKTESRFFAQRLHRRQAALPPLGSIFVEYRVLGRVLLIFRCVAFA
jgi:hypothetical protein